MHRYPAFIILLALVVSVLTAVGGASIVLRTPWLGLTLTPDEARRQVRITSVDPSGPSRLIVTPLVLRSISSIGLNLADLVEEPDQFSTYAEIDAFVIRQSALRAILDQPQVRLGAEDSDGTIREIEVTPGKRPVSSLPATFWIQIASGIAALLTSSWIWALRQKDLGARLFGASGVGLFLSAAAAAVYSSREIALDGTLFRVLSFTNHLGGVVCSGGLALLFLSYPRRLIQPSVLWLLVAVGAVWLLLDTSHLLPYLSYGVHAAVATFFIIIIVAIAAQWAAASKDPASRAIVRWLGTCVTIGTCTFIAFVTAPLLIGREPILRQAITFIFLSLIYGGIAIGVSRYRLFELGEWAFRLVFYFAAAFLLFALDAALIVILRLDHGISLGLAFLAVGFGYLPLRDFLWRRLVSAPRASSEELFGRVVEVVLSPSAEIRSRRWRELMERLFDPLEMEPLPASVREPAIRNDGLEMVLPATSVSPALALRYPWRGRGLFSPDHVRVASQAVTLVEQANSSREAYERGATEERNRIARDLHDDVGARLLTGLHKKELSETRETIRAAMADLRIVIGGLTGKTRPLGEVLGDLRSETIERVEAAGLRISWPVIEESDTLLAYGTYKNLISTFREVISNALKHSQASEISVLVASRGSRVHITISDDGVGLPQPDASRLTAGLGLSSMGQRMIGIGGNLSIETDVSGTTIRLEFPLPPVTAHSFNG